MNIYSFPGSEKTGVENGIFTRLFFKCVFVRYFDMIKTDFNPFFTFMKEINC